MSALPPLSSSSQPKVGWNTYRNRKFDFTLQYPPGFELVVGPLAEDVSQPFWEDENDEVIVNVSSTMPGNAESGTLDIIVHNKDSTSTDEYGDAPGFWSIPLQVLMSKIQSLTATDNLAAPRVTIVGGETAYEFTLNNGIVGWNGLGEVLGGENLWIFMQAKNSVLEITLPDTPTFKDILETLKFTESDN